MKSLVNRLFIFGLLVALLAACAPGKIPVTGSNNIQIENPYAPQSGDAALVRDTVRIVKTEISAQNNVPPKFDLKISYFLPTPCHLTRMTVGQPGADNRISVEVYSLMKKDQPCTLMALATPLEASLTLGNLATGHYTVWVNGEKALEFDA
jgi:hypothetical protein